MEDFIALIKSLIATRGAQLLSRYLGIGLALLATYTGASLNATDSSGFISVVSGLVVSALLILVDHISHSLQKTPAK